MKKNVVFWLVSAACSCVPLLFLQPGYAKLEITKADSSNVNLGLLNENFSETSIPSNLQEIDSHAFIPDDNLLIANASNGLCDGTFSHEVGNVYFTYDYATGRLAFAFILSPGSQLILGQNVTVAMLEAVVGWYKINPPYAPHTQTSNYQFHGSIRNYNRLGSSGNFTVQRGDRILFTWLATSTDNRRAAVIRAVECRIP
ncbi:hypothetical protein IQ241_11625 [Romeria aff. gracilis LEGE 07310]|uniref:Uncharacterized protein n=1 Tax=Vasconcelosia minhoensis LEGE 07310 TaxID=915328 RepID=A0A8J7ANY9_9CYAN|nr:hypothetical protein [Romeria gracilis]MBE9077934.1 hypothetical protein [Romeria aff. gracilis LEGE 07310]